jgi:hypothetical protein
MFPPFDGFLRVSVQSVHLVGCRASGKLDCEQNLR